MGSTYPAGRLVVLLLLITAALAVAETLITLPPPPPSKWHIHVVNGLNNGALVVHCQSKDNDLGEQNLAHRGIESQWSFEENIWKTTLFWCFVRKPGASVSFKAFWHESTHLWLVSRCKDKTCIWTAKDDGIYLKNIPRNVDELVYKWEVKLNSFRY